MVSTKRSKKKKTRSNAPRAAAKTAEKEVTRLGGALRYLGGLGGRMAGGLLGFGDAGAGMGHDLGGAISRWLGSGDYTVSANTIVQRASAAGTIPSMHRDGQSITVRHKEFLTEIRGKQSFTVQQQFSINPGLSTTFPWLAGIAAQYSEYRVKGMVYHYVPTSGNAVSSTNAALGTVMLQTSYRASEASPTSKVELLNEYWASEAKPSEGFCHPIECDPKENPFNIQYVRTGSVPSGDSVLMYDLGKTTLAVSGQQADDIVLGDLWVTYEIELRKPVLTVLNNLSISTYTGSGNSSVNTTNIFGTNFATRLSSFQVTPVVGTNTITFGKGSTGSYLVLLEHDGTVTAASYNANTISGTGSSILTVMGAANAKSTAYTVGTVSPFVAIQISITNPETTTVLTLSASVLTGATGAQLIITEINPTIL